MAAKLGLSYDEIFEKVCDWNGVSPFVSHPDAPWERICYLLHEWWTEIFDCKPPNENGEDPLKRNYRQTIDPGFFAAITKPKS